MSGTPRETRFEAKACLRRDKQVFGHDSLPTRIYSYGAHAPLANLSVVEEQMRLAHRYRNTLVELEVGRRQAVDAALAAISPRLAVVEAAVLASEEVLEARLADLRREQSAQRQKVRPTALVTPITIARDGLRALRAERKTLRVALFAAPKWKERQAALADTWTAAGRAARAASGLYWGNYLHIDQSMAKARTGPPPKFQHWDGGGHLVVQLQHGLAVPDLLGGGDTRLQLLPAPLPPGWSPVLHGPPRNPDRPHPRHRLVRFRVGSTGPGGREPVWADVPIVLHRPLPADARVKWGHLIRRRIGTHCEWRVQFVLARDAWEPKDRAAGGVVGVDIGWRLRPGRTGSALRVAYWVGDDGGEGELLIDGAGKGRDGMERNWLGLMRKTEDIRSIRDGLLNDAKAALSRRLQECPTWLSEAAATLSSWRSQDRLAALVLRWRHERASGDDCVYEEAEGWRRRDKHLLEYEANLRDQLQRGREHLYRNFAAELRRRYLTIVLEAAGHGEMLMDLRPFHVLPAAEEPPQDGALKEHVRDACLSSLRQYLVESGATVGSPAKGTTAICWRCGGGVERSDDGALRLRCSQCGQLEDQDRNAAIRLLVAGGGAPRDSLVMTGRSK